MINLIKKDETQESQCNNLSLLGKIRNIFKDSLKRTLRIELFGSILINSPAGFQFGREVAL